MKTIQLSNGTIHIPENIHELNIAVYNRYQYYLAMASNMGNDMGKVKANFDLFFRFMKTKDYEKASQWVHNAYYSLYLNQQQTSPLQMAFALLTLKPDEYDQVYSESFLKSKVEELARLGLTQQQVQEELGFFHPGLSSSSG